MSFIILGHRREMTHRSLSDAWGGARKNTNYRYDDFLGLAPRLQVISKSHLPSQRSKDRPIIIVGTNSSGLSRPRNSFLAILTLILNKLVHEVNATLSYFSSTRPVL